MRFKPKYKYLIVKIFVDIQPIEQHYMKYIISSYLV